MTRYSASAFVLVALVLHTLLNQTALAATTPTTQMLQTSLERRAQGAPGTPCEGTGPSSQCGYVSDDDQTTVVFGYCSPSGFCADNGAYCVEQGDCYNFCGTDNTCGGAGAYCSSRSTVQRDDAEATCYHPTFTCSQDTPGGTCVLNPSAAARMDRRRGLHGQNAKRARGHDALAQRLRRASLAVARTDDEAIDA